MYIGNGIRNGRFLAAMEQVTQWIRERKRFAYVSPNYIVVGMEYDEYKKLFAKKQRDFNYEIFEDEIARLTDEDYEKLAQKLNLPLPTQK